MVCVLVQESRLQGHAQRAGSRENFSRSFLGPTRRTTDIVEVISSQRKQIRHHYAFDPLKQSNML